MKNLNEYILKTTINGYAVELRFKEKADVKIASLIKNALIDSHLRTVEIAVNCTN